jgi:hypothetical protein
MDVHILIVERGRVAEQFRSTLTCLGITRAQLIGCLTDEGVVTCQYKTVKSLRAMAVRTCLNPDLGSAIATSVRATPDRLHAYLARKPLELS